MHVSRTFHRIKVTDKDCMYLVSMKLGYTASNLTQRQIVADHKTNESAFHPISKQLAAAFRQPVRGLSAAKVRKREVYVTVKKNLEVFETDCSEMRERACPCMCHG